MDLDLWHLDNRGVSGYVICVVGYRWCLVNVASCSVKYCGVSLEGAGL